MVDLTKPNSPGGTDGGEEGLQGAQAQGPVGHVDGPEGQVDQGLVYGVANGEDGGQEDAAPGEEDEPSQDFVGLDRPL